MHQRISVIMSVYNGEKWLNETICSILDQSFTDFEFIIIDDGSTDKTGEILNQHTDRRILIIRNDKNLGLTRSLNKGFEISRGEFIARIDADDISNPERLAVQVNFLEKNPDIGIVGNICRIIDEKGRVIYITDEPRSDLMIRWRSLIAVPFQHSSVMLRKRILDDHGLRYDETLITAQDYDLWIRLLKHTNGANIQNTLVTRHFHKGGIGHVLYDRQREDHATIALSSMESLFPGHGFTVERFNKLKDLLSADRAALLDNERYSIINDYATLLGKFVEKWGKEETAALRKRETIFLTYLSLRPPWRKGLASLLRNLGRLQPGLTMEFLIWLLGAVPRRLGISFKQKI